MTGDEIISKLELEYIDTSKSNRYCVDDGILYEKTKSGEKGAQIAKIGEVVEGKG